MSEFIELNRRLHCWYAEHKRDLPWRNNVSPYRVWISEVILQQTRVDQGTDYYHRFVERFPDVVSLAAADEQEVLKYWQGLGYYSRARNLHKAAQQVVEHFDGKLPDNYNDLLKLKGVGPYTAAAIASIAYGLPHAVVDGNVYRVLSRLFGVELPIDTGEGKREFALLADLLLDREHPSAHNQAMMELGALVCLPRRALCDECPLAERCYALQEQRVYDFPFRRKRVKVRARYLSYFHIVDGDYTYLKQRKGRDIWRNLYEFPLLEHADIVGFESVLSAGIPKEVLTGINIEAPEGVETEHRWRTKHILTHQVLHVNFFRIDLSEGVLEVSNPDVLRVHIDDMDKYPVSALIEKYLRKLS